MVEFLKSAWWLFVNTGYLLIILIASALVFLLPAQTDDFIYVFLQDFDLRYLIAVYIALPLWCFFTWYSACINLQVDPVAGSLRRKTNKLHGGLALLVPKLLGMVPCGIMAIAFLSADLATDNHQVLNLVIVGATALVMWSLFEWLDRSSDLKSSIGSKSMNEDENMYRFEPGTFRKHLRRAWKNNLGKWPSLREVENFKKSTGYEPTIAQEMIFIAQFTGVRFFFVYMGVTCLVLTLVMCVPAWNMALSSLLRPGAILIVAITCFTLLFTIIAYFHDYTRRPFGLIVVILIILFSLFNDNTSLNYLNNKNVKKRLKVDVAFDAWLNRKRPAWEALHGNKDMPVIMIATQGGGIRGLSWTTRVFNYLDTAYPGFLNQTFVISGVSGGGVGATAYLSWLRDRQLGIDPIPGYEHLDGFTKRDHLSTLTASFAFGDNFQRFLPVPISALERSKMLGFTWNKYYKECVGHDSFSKSFLEMWYPGKGFNYNLPSLMLNGTLAENGQRVITSNLDVAASTWFADDIDFFNFTRRDINRSFAALNCSRFPFITSGGLMEGGGTRKGHIVDGGYRENTGLQTLFNVFCTVRERIRKETGLRLVVIYLQNGSDERDDNVTASRVFQDVLVPLQGVVSVNGTGLPAKSIVQVVRQTMDTSIYANVKFFVLSLEDRQESEIKLPLGWYMSDIVSQEIDKRVKDIPELDAELTRSMKEMFEN
jgi:hypothetical protein